MKESLHPLRPGEARCDRAPTTQEVVHRDGRPVPAILEQESYRFLGDEDIPFERYTSRAFYDLEMERMWPRTWQWACREEHIPEVGDYYVYDIGKYSILVVRSHEGIKAYHNSCLHRGTKLRPSGTDGHASELRCPFHGWTWSLEGGLTRLPCAWDLPHVDPEAFKLPEVRVGLWGGFVFVNMDPDAPSLEEYIAPLGEHFAGWDLSRRYVDVHIQKELFSNWKTAQQAFVENYHTQETHPQLLSGNGDEITQYDVLGRHLTRFYAANGVSSPHLDRPLTEQELVSTMLVGDRTMLDDGDLTVSEGETARVVMARVLRKVLGGAYRADMSAYTDTEILDVMEYCLFPNMILFPGLSLPMVYRFRPLGDDPDRSLFDLIFLRPVPDDGERPEPAMPVRLTETESYTNVPGIDPAFAHVYDQDTDNLRAQQEGFHAAHKKAQTLTNYQEVQIRHMEQTLDLYLERQDMIRGIHHIALNTGDLDRLRDFYVDVIGFEPAVPEHSWADSPESDAAIGLRGSVARQQMLKAGNCYLELFEYSAPPARAGEPNRPCDRGYTHFALDVTDIEAEYDRLAAAGMTFAHERPLDFGDIQAVYGKDPDGNIIEIQQTTRDQAFALAKLGTVSFA